MAIAFVQEKAAFGNGTPFASFGVTPDSNVTAGNLLVAVVYWIFSGTPISLSDNQGNTWTAATSAAETGNYNRVRMYYAIAGSTGSLTVTFSDSGVPTNETVEMVVLEYSGAATSSQPEAAATSTVANGTVNVISTSANALIIAAATDTASAMTAGSGYTARYTGSTISYQAVVDMVDGGAAGSHTAEFSGMTGSTAKVGAAFTLAATAATYPPGGANISAGSWTTSTGSGTLASMMDETPADDADYIQSGLNPSSDVCEVPLLNVQAPSTNTGHVVRYRIKGDASTVLAVSVIGGDGSTVVKTWTHTYAPSSYTLYEQTLSTGEADAWAAAGYPGSRLRFTAS